VLLHVPSATSPRTNSRECAKRMAALAVGGSGIQPPCRGSPDCRTAQGRHPGALGRRDPGLTGSRDLAEPGCTRAVAVRALADSQLPVRPSKSPTRSIAGSPDQILQDGIRRMLLPAIRALDANVCFPAQSPKGSCWPNSASRAAGAVPPQSGRWVRRGPSSIRRLPLMGTAHGRL
jgi:hypothetical protein